MDSRLNTLRKFRLTTEKTQSVFTIEARNLLDDQILREYLDFLQNHIGAANEKVTASIFIKRYAFLAVIYLYVMTVWNEKWNISYENVSLETNDRDKLWIPSFYFSYLETEISQGDREKWVANCIEDLFKGHLSPILDMLSQHTKISKLILWENIVVYISWLYKTVLLEEGIHNDIIKRANKDLLFLVSQASGELFGDYKVNPLMRFYKEESGNNARKRSTCCYSHLTNSKKYCATCPHAYK